jgi:hypothetical protein
MKTEKSEVTWCIHQQSPERQKQLDTETYEKGRIRRIGLCDYGG